MRGLFIALAFLIALTVPALGKRQWVQNIQQTALSDDARSVQVLNNRLLWNQLWRPAPSLAGSLDVVYAAYDANLRAYVAWLGGWSISCEANSQGHPLAADIIVGDVDGYRFFYATDYIGAGGDWNYITSPVSVPRQDVVNWANASGWSECVPREPGWWYLLNTSSLAPGTYWAKLRFYDTTSGLSRETGSIQFSR